MRIAWRSGNHRQQSNPNLLAGLAGRAPAVPVATELGSPPAAPPPLGLRNNPRSNPTSSWTGASLAVNVPSDQWPRFPMSLLSAPSRRKPTYRSPNPSSGDPPAVGAHREELGETRLRRAALAGLVEPRSGG